MERLTMEEVKSIKNHEWEGGLLVAVNMIYDLCNTIESQQQEIEQQKEIIQVLTSTRDQYRSALLNLADYVLTGEYKMEALKLLGLLDDEESEVYHG